LQSTEPMTTKPESAEQATPSGDTAPEHRPLLVIVSDSDSLPAELRSRSREVCRWHEGGGAGTFAGDPADAATYEWTREAPSVTAVIDLEPPSRARAALDALRSVRQDSAVLLLTPHTEDLDGPGDGTLARAGKLRDVLRVDIEEELERLEAERRVYCLRRFVEGADVVPILIHNDPDPDAVSSALAVGILVNGSPERTPIVTLDAMTRPENRRMAELLHIRITRVTREEVRSFDRIITVDTQPRGLQQDGHPRFAVIDHHPPEQDYHAEFTDIRPHYGATATMLTEYRRALDEKRIQRALATALLFGIRTDTDSLMRGVTPADVAAYAFLQERADHQLIRRFERPSYTKPTARAFGEALAGAEHDDDLVVACLGRLPTEEAHVLTDLADFCLAIENVTWVVAVAELEDELVLTLRHTGKGRGAGSLARALAGMGGKGGGHAAMARAALPLDRARELLGGNADAPAVLGLIRRVMEDERNSVSRRDSRPAHPASVR
jgi:nanoRNase/pAp phosphatase (c-di-AMP/oligoRNAs hydrolase)